MEAAKLARVISMTEKTVGLTKTQKRIKRVFDLFIALVGLTVVWPFILLGWIAAAISTKANGFFIQSRIGKDGKPFPLIKLRSMKAVRGFTTSVTSDSDVRITRTGRLLRKLKIDELPQLFNVVLGHMSMVGPRPDVPGFADELTGEDRIVLSIRPGVTGPASIAFRKEEEILAGVEDPEKYNREVIWPEKVRINIDYIHNYSLGQDLKYIWRTAIG